MDLWGKLGEGVVRLLGFNERTRYLLSQSQLVEGATHIDPTEAFKHARSEFWHLLRLAALLSFGPAVVLFMMSVFGVELLPAVNLVSIFLVYVSVVFYNKSYRIFFKENDFTKSPPDNELYEFIDQFGGPETLRKWTTEYPNVGRFVAANKMLESYSVFEFELVQTYVHSKRKSVASGTKIHTNVLNG